MHHLKIFFSLFCLITFPISGITSENKSACVLPRDAIFTTFTYWNYCSDTFWNNDGKKREAYNTFEKYAYRLFIEYGLTCSDTLSVKGGWAKVDESINGNNLGFEAIEIGWKHQLGTRWNKLFSAELIAIIPITTQYKPGHSYGQYGAEFNLLSSQGFNLYRGRASYDARLGYRLYEGFPSDQLLANIAVNLCPLAKLQLIANIQLEYGIYNGSSRIDASFFLFNPNYRLLKGEIQAIFRLYKQASLFLGYHQHFWGRNVGTNGGFSGGAQIQF